MMRREKSAAMITKGSMASDRQTIWREICARLQGLVNRDVFQLWFERIRVTDCTDGTLTLSVPDDFSLIWIEENYAGLVRDVARQATGEPLKIQYVVQPLPLEKAEAGREANAMAAPRETAAARPQRARAEVEQPSSTFNPRNTFANFVVGENNNVAHAAAWAAAQSPGAAYNPLFIYGATGLGKTHLVQAIGSHLASQKNRMRVLYFSCETFTNEYVEALKQQTLLDFRRKYRSADALLVDDVHFLSGKERLQEEFFHTFNALFESRRQIVMTSDRPVGEIENLEQRLVSRFEWGMVTEILSPDYETRLAILRKKLESLTVEVAPEILEFIAHRIKSNVRRLEGALVRVASYSSLTGKPLTLPAAEQLLRDSLKQEGASAVSVELIQRVVAEHYLLRPEDMTSKSRPQSIAFPRQVAMYLSRQLTRHSLAEIGAKFGGRDHGTVIHACRLVESRLKNDTALREVISQLEHQTQCK
jgi:chromosomal replication initiator protein